MTAATSLAGTLALAGIAALDATPVAQTMLSQPLVTASLLGLLWGDWPTALAVGIVLQMLAASTLPIGARTPEDYPVGAVVGVTLAILLAREAPFEMARSASMMLGSLAGMLTATLGVPLLKWQRRRNEGLSRWCEAEIVAGNSGALATAHAASVAFSFAVAVAFTALCLAVGWFALRPLVVHDSIRLARAWTLAQPLWLGLGLAQLLHAFVQRRLTRAAVFAVSLLASWLLLMVGLS